MPKSSTRIAIEAVAVVALAAVAWRGFRADPTPPPPAGTAAPARERDDRIGNALQQRRAEEAANRQKAAEAFRVEATAPAEEAAVRAPEGVIAGELVDEQGRRLDTTALLISEAGGFTLTAANGVFRGAAPPGEWPAVAQYRDGLRIRRTAPFTVRVEEGRETTLSIPLPLGPTGEGEPGFTWVHRGEFLEVLTVAEGSPAALVGLAPGDAILEIGDQPVKDSAAPALETALAGEAGSAFRIKVAAHTGDGLTTTVVDLRRVPKP